MRPRRPAVVLRAAGRRYGERAALRDVALSRAGRTLVVFGPNGAGKTTLLRMLATLLRPHAGEVRVLGRAAARRRLRGARADRLSRPRSDALSRADGRENLRFYARLHRVARPRVDAVLDAVGMTARAEDPVAELSKGMVQRLAIARAVLHEPDLLLLDEPLANLDPAAARQVAPLIGPASGRRASSRATTRPAGCAGPTSRSA